MDAVISLNEIIQLMLAPAIMSGACGLLLDAMDNKYNHVVTRIRLLNEERRVLAIKCPGFSCKKEEMDRLNMVIRQLDKLLTRVRFIRDAVLSFSGAIIIFTITSFFIGVQFLIQRQSFLLPITGIFLAGMILVLIGSVFVAREIIWDYAIITMEVKGTGQDL